MKNYLEIYARMCSSYSEVDKFDAWTSNCISCPLGDLQENNRMCSEIASENFEILDKWDEAHPRETIKSELLKKYPKAKISGM